MPCVVWAEESKTGLRFEIEPPQQKCQREPTLQSLSNPAVSFLVKTGVRLPAEIDDVLGLCALRPR